MRVTSISVSDALCLVFFFHETPFLKKKKKKKRKWILFKFLRFVPVLAVFHTLQPSLTGVTWQGEAIQRGGGGVAEIQPAPPAVYWGTSILGRLVGHFEVQA